MKKMLSVLSIILLTVVISYGQVWTFDSDFAQLNNPHGVVVTPDGKIWTANYSKTDTFVVSEGDTLFTNPIYIYNPDGTLETTLRTVNFGTEIDTLVNTCRGISLDQNGNVLYTHYGEIFQINYLTHEMIAKFTPDIVASMTEAAATSDGYIYAGHVGGGKPFYILDDALELFGYVTDTLQGLQRSVVCSPDGNDIYVGKIYTKGYGVWHYKSTDGAGAESESFALIDTFGTVFDDTGAVKHAMWGQCLDWDNNGLLWVGTYWAVDSVDFTGWYGLDPTQDWAVVDTIGHLFIEPNAGWQGPPTGVGAYYAPRGITWTADGKTAYTADFDGGYIKKWTNPDPKKPGDSIIPLSDLVLSLREVGGKPNVLVSFELKQNYPNPFNPSTTIPFSINGTKHVVLKVYDITGRLVSTLIDQKLTPNHYEFEFDGSNLSSGTYIYQLSVDGQLINKKMLLVK